MTPDPANPPPEVLASEAHHFDTVWGEASQSVSYGINERYFGYYGSPSHAWNYREHMALLLGPVRGKRLFDMGCGIGEESTYFARLGAHVVSMDISPEGVRQTRERALHNGLSVEASVGDVTNTGFPDESFDLIHGLGVLHHTGLEVGMREANRLLAPGGRAVFSEHMSSSKLVDRLRSWYNRDAEEISDHERPLTWSECRALRRRYRVKLYRWSFLYRLRRPLSFLSRDWNWALRLDNVILKLLPPLRHGCGAVIIVLEK